MTFGIFENDLFGEESIGVRTAAADKALAIAVHEAKRDFLPYLKLAENQDDLDDRVSQVLAAMQDDGVDQPERVLERLAAEDEGDDKDDVPDFVDTDKDDSKDRDDEADDDKDDDKERKESAKSGTGQDAVDRENAKKTIDDAWNKENVWGGPGSDDDEDDDKERKESAAKLGPDGKYHHLPLGEDEESYPVEPKEDEPKKKEAYVGKHRSNIKAAQYPVVPRGVQTAQSVVPLSGGNSAVPRGVQTAPVGSQTPDWTPPAGQADPLAGIDPTVVPPNAPGRHRASVVPTRPPLPFVPRRVVR